MTHELPPTTQPSAPPLSSNGTGISTSGIQPGRALNADEMADAIGESALNEVYMFMFYRRAVDIADLREAGFHTDLLAASLKVLAARGLIVAGERGQWVVVPPSRSFPPLAARLEERAQLLRTSLPGLSAAYRSAGGEDEDLDAHGIEFLGTAQDVTFALTQCYAQAESKVVSMVRDSLETREATFEALPSLRQGRIGVAQRTLICMTVLHTSLVQAMTAEAFASLDDLSHETFMVSAQVPASVTLNDTGMAVIEFSADDQRQGLLLNHAYLVGAIQEVIDLVIAHSTAWKQRDAPTPELNTLTEPQQEILRMLSLGVPDATIARRLGISARTFDRRLRAILDALGATTRFHAGVIAARNNWL